MSKIKNNRKEGGLKPKIWNVEIRDYKSEKELEMSRKENFIKTNNNKRSAFNVYQPK